MSETISQVNIENVIYDIDAKSLNGKDSTDFVPSTRTVNGKKLSNNISLAAADVGAAVNKGLASVDLNTIVAPGFYNAGGGNNCTNRPTGVDYFGLEVIHNASGNYYTQRLYSLGKSFIRHCTNGTWTDWKEDASLSDIPTNYIVGGSQTSTSSANGGSNVYTFTNADGTTSTFTVKNGTQGTKGDSAVWFTGTVVTGTATTATAFTVSGSKAGDMYLNTTTWNVYRASAANSWIYVCNIKGAKGDSVKGDPGTGVTISSTSVTYQASSSGTTVPTGTWSTTVPTVSNGQYLWTKTYVKYSDNKETTSYAVGYKGTNATTTAVATQTANGLMSAADKTKLDEIATGAEVNQNAFSTVQVGTTKVVADTKTDTLTLVAGDNVTITPDATNDKITIASTQRALGTTADTACAGNDSRLSDARTPKAHNQASNTINAMTGYSKPSSTSAIAATDTLNAAMGKLEKALDGKQASGSYVPTTRKVNGKALSADITLSASDVGAATQTDIETAINALPEPMIFKGSLGTGGTITALPTAAADNEGFTYKVITAGKYANISAKVGDTFISDGKTWVLIPSGDEPSGTVTSVGVSVPTGLAVTGSPVTSSGTIAVNYASGYSIPTNAKQTSWDGKYTKPSSGIPASDLADTYVKDDDARLSDARIPKSHNQPSWTINAMTGYSKPSTTSAIAAMDTLNAAIGKLEKALDDKGTSNLQLGTTSTTAAAGNHNHNSTYAAKSHSHVVADITDFPSAATTTANGLMSATDKKRTNLLYDNLVTCTTARNVVTKKVSLDDFELRVGAVVCVKFTDTGTANPASGNLTLNVNGTGDIGIRYINGWNKTVISYSSGGYYYNNITHIFLYDGAYWIDTNFNANNTYSNLTLGQGYGTCDTAKATTAKVVTMSDYTLSKGGIVTVKFTYDVPGAATMNINNRGAKPIFYNGAAISTGVIRAGNIATFIYDGTNYILLGIDKKTSSALVGSDAASSNGWYKFATITMMGNDDFDATYAVTSQYASCYHGIYSIHLRFNGTDLTAENMLVQTNGWLTRQGFASGAIRIVVNKNIATLYINNTVAQYNYISFEEIDTMTGRKYDSNARIEYVYNMGNSTKEATEPDATYTSTDISAVAQAANANTVNGLTVQTAVPANAKFTDTKVTSAFSTTNADEPILLNNGTAATTNTVLMKSGATINPSTGNLKITQINGVTVGTSPNFADTKNTAGVDSTTDKLFLIGAKSQTGTPQTYTNVNVYTENGGLYLSKDGDTVPGGSTKVPHLTIGPPTGERMEFDGNEIMARGTTGNSGLYLNNNGGLVGLNYTSDAPDVRIGAATASQSNTALTVNGSTTISGSATVADKINITSAVSMQYNSTNQCLDFIFN